MDRNFNKYIVIKTSDAEEALEGHELDTLYSLGAAVDKHRIAQGRHSMRCVVVEEDWPMYEQTWSSIEEWIDKLQKR